MPAIKCTFHHVSNDAVESVSSLLGIPVSYQKTKNELSHSCSASTVESVRSVFTKLRQQYPQIWLSIPPMEKSGSGFFPFMKNIANEVHVSFGALLSTSTFFTHDTPLNNRNLCHANFPNERTFVIDCVVDEKTNGRIRLALPMKCIAKTILVKESDSYSEIILNFQTITADVRVIENEKHERLYGDHPLVESLSRCRDLLLRISSKTDTEKFLLYLAVKHSCQIFYTNISMEQYSGKIWDTIEFNWYPADEALYGISMLHSLGYLFDDKYMTNSSLQSTMVTLAEENDKLFYQLTVKAHKRLQENHGLDLTTIFNEIELKKTRIKISSSPHYVGVVCITPTCFSIVPKVEDKGHRAMRHQLFHGANHFCLVNLIPDPSNEYLATGDHALNYFRKIFENGLEIGRHRYHLFGSSNSRLKEHAFWFVKANSLEEINEKRLQLGDFDGIDNLGTYVARLGLWFSGSSPTGIELVYCQNLNEFNERVQRKEICVMEIKDIKRNGYDFTDGNGFISKGLAKRVAETLCLSSTTSPDIIPSAYQIRVAGCKGLLIIDPQSTFDQFYVRIRKSMRKFESNDWTLDICETSRATATSLNNQIILLLSDLGVPDETFLRLQKQWLKKNPTTSRYSDTLVKNKIPLPTNECRYMYGCAFESRLPPGTCFIRYEVLDEHGKPLSVRQFQCVQGRVIVTKNPCPYAGDLLELTAVDLPELHCLSDVIVFSTADSRPDCNKIAGSDFDGDQYFVYWGGEFQLQRSVPPLDYQGDAKIPHPTAITPLDVIHYCLSTLGATSYGEIYNLHAVVVDKNEENHCQRTCQQTAIELARMFSSAIDSGKTGYQIDRKRIQELRDKYGKEYPDFLRKYNKSFYKSQSIIGQLYRNAMAYKKGDFDQLNDQFSKLGLGDQQLENVPRKPFNALPVNTSTELTNSTQKAKNPRSYRGKKSLK